MSIIYLTPEQFNLRAKTIETKNLKKYHRTPYWLTILNKLRQSVVEIESGTGISTVDEEKYKALRIECMSEEFCNPVKQK